MKTKILEMLNRPDFNCLVLETKTSLNIVSKIIQSEDQYIWVNSSKNSPSKELNTAHSRAYFYPESLTNELLAAIDVGGEEVNKITTMLVHYDKD